MSNYCDYTIIIPTLNEKNNLCSLLALLGSLYPGCRILVADDGSDDGTFEYISSLIEEKDTLSISFIDRKREVFLSSYSDSGKKQDYLFSRGKQFIPGLNASLLDAFKLLETEKFAVIDGDFQHPLSLPGEMYDKLSNCDLVCAFREKLTGLSVLRRIVSRIGITAASLSLPPHFRSVKDPLSGAFAGRKSSLKPYLFATEDFPPQGFKFLYRLLKILPPEIKTDGAGYTIEKRKKGKSKIGYRQLKVFFSALSPRIKKIFYGAGFMFMLIAASFIIMLFGGDKAISASLHGFVLEKAAMFSFLEKFTDLGLYFYYLLFALVMAAAFIKKKKKLKKMALIYICSQLLGSVFITGGFKVLTGRPRPYVHHQSSARPFTYDNDFHSFPSRHSSDAFAGAGVIWTFSQSYFLSVLFFLFSALIALSRVFIGVHYFSDILAGSFIGFFSVFYIYFKLKPRL